MKIIIPMAGKGMRLRPHTLTTPKPLLKLAGKEIVHWLAYDLARMTSEPIEEISFIVGSFGKEVEERLLQVARNLGTTGKIYYQEQPLGTAHAVLCAAPSLKGNVIVAFADTLFRADFQIDKNKDAIIWTKRVPNPSSFGVVTTNEYGEITSFVEKPKTFVSDLAIIGIYYFQKAELLKSEIEYLIENNFQVKGEYQLTDALENMRKKGIKLYTATVQDWLDCGNKETTVATNAQYMKYLQQEGYPLLSKSALNENSVLIPPVYIGENVLIRNSVIGPYVSVGNNTKIEQSVVMNSIIQENTLIENAQIANSMIGSFVKIKLKTCDWNIGDYNTIEL